MATLLANEIKVKNITESVITNIVSFAHNEFCPHRLAQNENGFAQKSISRSN